MRSDQSVVCYVNSVFAPGLDEGVGGLFKVCGTLPLSFCCFLSPCLGGLCALVDFCIVCWDLDRGQIEVKNGQQLGS